MDRGMTRNAAAAGDFSAAAIRTAAFLAAGLALLAVGTWLVLRPTLRSRNVTAETAVGKPLFPELSDAAKAGSLEIVSFDEETATLSPFKVVKSGGVWVLPSHQNYPADAREQLAAAATELVDRPIVDVKSMSPGDHELYGVKEPDADKVTVGETGVGQLVEIRDDSGNKLARLVIGKEFKRPGAAAGGEGGRTLRYVRRAGQDPVYLVELDTSKFTTRFDDWIEKDLLRLSPWDVVRVTIDDATCGFEVDGERILLLPEPKSRIELSHADQQSPAWSLVKLVDFGRGGKGEEKPLPEGQELAATRLGDLLNSLRDLTIVDVVRKPAGLSADLKADEKFTGDDEARLSLARRGFFALDSNEILSSSGATIVGMKDGVEYLLRFGNTTTVAEEAKPAAGEEKPAGEGSGRYLFVMVRFNEELIEKPTLQPLPEVPAVPGATPPADGTPAKPAEGGNPPAAPATGTPPAPPAAPAPTTPSAPAPAPATPAAGAQGPTDAEPGTGGEAGQPADAPVSPAGAPTAPADPAAPPTPSAPAAPGSTADPAAPAAPGGAAAATLGQADEAEARAQAALEERRRVERENRQAQEDYDQRVKAGQKRVRELNIRFADWYYIVSDAEFAKIRLGRADVFQPKPPADAPPGPPADGAPPVPPPGPPAP